MGQGRGGVAAAKQSLLVQTQQWQHFLPSYGWISRLLASGPQNDETTNGPGSAVHQAAWPATGQASMMTARTLSVVLILLGVVLVGLGGGLILGVIPRSWGFSLSPISFWGRKWAIVLILFGAAYLVCPIWFLVRPRQTWLAMLIVCGISLLSGTPVIQSSTEILYNLTRDQPRRPDWANAVWAFYMMVVTGLLVALYQLSPPQEASTEIDSPTDPSPSDAGEGAEV